MNIDELKVSLFANHHAYSNALVTLKEIVRLIRHDQNIAANTESYRKTKDVMGKKHADRNIKRNCCRPLALRSHFMVWGIVKGRPTIGQGWLCAILIISNRKKLWRLQ